MKLEVSEIGVGTWGMGGTWWGPADDDEAVRSIHLAMDLGVNFLDTAYSYGDGHSERVVAKALRQKKGRALVATKVPPKNMKWPARHDVPVAETFPGDWIRSCTERSLCNLDTDCIDVQQLHVWSDTWMGTGDWLQTVRDLKQEGKIRFFGVSINDHEPDSALQIVECGVVDTVQVIYNIFDQSPQRKLLPQCRDMGVGVIVRVPFDEGGLTGTFTRETKFDKDDFRFKYFGGDRLGQTIDRVDKLGFLVRREIGSIAQAALKFCLSHPAVSTVIPGMRRRGHVEENCAVSDGIPLAPEELEALREHAWEKDFYAYCKS
jgi:aryl-alcohol dehydrogenase-like predicted oxidoreductase